MLTTEQKKDILDWKKQLPKGTIFKMDSVLFYNQGIKLEHTGGESGHYIQIQPEGETVLGTYEGALQWITDAIFNPEVHMDLSIVDSTHVLHTLTNRTN